MLNVLHFVNNSCITNYNAYADSIKKKLNKKNFLKIV